MCPKNVESELLDVHELYDQLCAMFEGGDTPCEYGCSKSGLKSAIKVAKAKYLEKPYCVIAK